MASVSKKSLSPYPRELMIEPTNACNLNCTLCPTGLGLIARPKRMMTFIEFKKIIDEVKKSVDTLMLWNYGEPFLNPEILKMIDYAVKAGIFVKTSTNGHFFGSKDFCIRLVKSGLNHLIASLDGADQKTLKKYKKKADFSAVISGIKNIVEAKKICDSKTPAIEIQFIIMKHNEHQLQAMRNLAAELGVDIYSEKTVSLHMHPDNPRFHRVARKYLPSDPSNSRYYLTPGGRFSLAGEIKNGCSMLYKSMVINSDGSVIPCCSDWYSDYVMGNIFREELQSIWKNKKYNALRRQVNTNKKSVALCTSCWEERYSLHKTREAVAVAQ